MRRRSTLLALATALALEVLAAGVANAEIVPHWRGARDGFVLGLVALCLGGGLLAWITGLRRKVLTWGTALAGGLLCLLLAVGGWLVLFLRTSDDWGLRSRRLVQSVDLSEARGELYVYEYEGVPDGFVETVVMLRAGLLPVMRPLVTARVHLGRISQEGEDLRFFLADAPDREVLRCNLSTQNCR